MAPEVELIRWRPGAARTVRGPHSLQLGVGDSAHLLDNLTAADWQLLAMVERGRTHEELNEGADRLGVPRRRCEQLLGLLQQAAAVEISEPGSPPHDQDPERGQLRGAHVAVVGGGGLGVLLAVGLAAAGTATSALVDDATVGAEDVLPGGALRQDIGRRATHVAAEAVHRLSPDVRTACPPRPDLVVLVSAQVPDVPAALPLVQSGVPHLSVVVRPGQVQVGPLVLPGRGACLHCLDLHQCDLDPGWADAVGLLRRNAARPQLPDPAVCAMTTGLCTLLAGSADQVTRAGVQVLLGTGGATSWQRWQPHPACGCIGWPDPDDPLAPRELPGATMAA